MRAPSRLRTAIAELAAELMLDEDIKQYFPAKRLAAKRLLGQGRSGSSCRLRELPSNGEIKEALLARVLDREGEAQRDRLFAMRIVALEAMAPLARFSPRLIGSVATGHVREGSDIDLHVFAQGDHEVIAEVTRLGWTHDVHRVSIRNRSGFMDFTHLLITDLFPIELTVYEPMAIRHRPKSSTDGKPIVRLSESAVRSLCEREHPELWEHYLRDGSFPDIEDLLQPDAEARDLIES